MIALLLENLDIFTAKTNLKRLTKCSIYLESVLKKTKRDFR